MFMYFVDDDQMSKPGPIKLKKLRKLNPANDGDTLRRQNACRVKKSVSDNVVMRSKSKQEINKIQKSESDMNRHGSIYELRKSQRRTFVRSKTELSLLEDKRRTFLLNNRGQRDTFILEDEDESSDSPTDRSTYILDNSPRSNRKTYILANKGSRINRETFIVDDGKEEIPCGMFCFYPKLNCFGLFIDSPQSVIFLDISSV